MSFVWGLPASSRSASAHRPRVVVFDLDPVVRHELDRQLEVLGWEAIPVDSAEDAVRIVELGFEVDILLADLEVPEMRGLEIARKVVSASPQTRIVFMASSAPIQPLDARDSPVLVKPFTAEELARTLARA